MNNPKFEVFKSSRNSEYYYRLKAVNGEIIMASEGYSTKQNCLNGIASVRINAPHDQRYERKDKTGNYTFNLKAINGETIGRSESYTTAANRENGIAAVKRDAPDAPIEVIA
jgi:uncharacterized protein YegP (UPF0339 family)